MSNNAPDNQCQPSKAEPCSCDWATGECQGPLGCQAVGEAVSLKARIQELEGALRPFARTGWMTEDIEHTDRAIIAHMHPEREREIILSSGDFKRARDLFAALSAPAGNGEVGS